VTRAPELRRWLLAIHRDDYNEARSTNPQLLVHPFTTVVPVPLRMPWTEVPELLAVEDRLQPGTLLVRNPWNGGRWIEATTAPEQLSVARFNRFAAVCQQLGACNLAVQELREVTDTGKVTAQLNLRAKALDGQGQDSSDRLDRLAASIRATWSWRTGALDIAAAARLAEEAGLADDPMIDGLIRQRRSPINPLDAHELELDVNTEARRELTAALELQTVLGRLGPALAGTFELIRSHSQQVRLTVELRFTAA
jgi:hypothetical protein